MQFFIGAYVENVIISYFTQFFSFSNVWFTAGSRAASRQVFGFIKKKSCYRVFSSLAVSASKLSPHLKTRGSGALKLRIRSSKCHICSGSRLSSDRGTACVLKCTVYVYHGSIPTYSIWHGMPLICPRSFPSKVAWFTSRYYVRWVRLKMSHAYLWEVWWFLQLINYICSILDFCYTRLFVQLWYLQYTLLTESACSYSPSTFFHLIEALSPHYSWNMGEHSHHGCGWNDIFHMLIWKLSYIARLKIQ
jgi:hypothetical protein